MGSGREGILILHVTRDGKEGGGVHGDEWTGVEIAMRVDTEKVGCEVWMEGRTPAARGTGGQGGREGG